MIELRNDKSGFTLTEIMFVMVISVIVIGVIVSAWVFTYRTWTTEGRRTVLRVDILNALETIKSDIRLSSATYMSFYPSSSTTGEYSAISMPIGDVDSNGLYPLDSSNKIDWDKTVIYHIHAEADGTKTLRRTVYDPRDNGMDRDELYQQLSDVVSDGHGGSGSTTDTEFLKNADNFMIRTIPAVIDFYEDSTTPVRVGEKSLGWVYLDTGQHTIRLEVTGKNDNSSGYAFGVDHIAITPSGSKREAEYYNSSFAPSGSIASSGQTITRVYDPTWSNQNYLQYDASGEGNYVEFTDYYDLWRESAFDHASLTNALLWDEEERVKLELPQDRQTGGEMIGWYAYRSTGDTQHDGRNGNFPVADKAMTLRTVLANASISTEGDLIRVKLKSSANNPLKVQSIYITRRDRSTDSALYRNGYPNQATGGQTEAYYHRHQQLFFKDTYDMDSDGSTTDIVPYVYIPTNSEVWSEWTAFPFKLKDSSNNNLDYFLTFGIPKLSTVTWPTGWTFNAASNTTKYWQGSSTNTYYITSANMNIAGTPVWTGVFTSASTSNNIYVNAEVDTWPKSGTVESDIYDTGLTTPLYNQAKWSEVAPTNTEILLKARSSSSQYMTAATAWGSIAGSTSNPQNLSIGNGEYVQFQATLSAVPFWKQASYTRTYPQYVEDQRALAVYSFPQSSGEYLVTGLYSTWMDDVAIDWPGGNKVCMISAYIARENDFGQAKVTIDGMDIVKVLGVDLGVKQTFQEKEITEELSVEVEPKNTGR